MKTYAIAYVILVLSRSIHLFTILFLAKLIREFFEITELQLSNRLEARLQLEIKDFTKEVLYSKRIHYVE